MSIKQAIEHLRLIDPVAADVAEKEVQKLKEDSFTSMMSKWAREPKPDKHTGKLLGANPHSAWLDDCK